VRSDVQRQDGRNLRSLEALAEGVVLRDLRVFTI
jgi:hypothetical protein